MRSFRTQITVNYNCFLRSFNKRSHFLTIKHILNACICSWISTCTLYMLSVSEASTIVFNCNLQLKHVLLHGNIQPLLAVFYFLLCKRTDNCNVRKRCNYERTAILCCFLVHYSYNACTYASNIALYLFLTQCLCIKKDNYPPQKSEDNCSHHFVFLHFALIAAVCFNLHLK